MAAHGGDSFVGSVVQCDRGLARHVNPGLEAMAVYLKNAGAVAQQAIQRRSILPFQNENKDGHRG